MSRRRGGGAWIPIGAFCLVAGILLASRLAASQPVALRSVRAELVLPGWARVSVAARFSPARVDIGYAKAHPGSRLCEGEAITADHLACAATPTLRIEWSPDDVDVEVGAVIDS